ncbi:hypothetical protein Tco_0097558, partial [Tanacetum coccineum]
LEVGWIRRIQWVGSGILEFLGVGTTFDIFQNIILIPYLEYGVLSPLYPKDSPFDLVAYTDSDYAGASLDRKSTTGGCQFLGCRLISGNARNIQWLQIPQQKLNGKKIIISEASVRRDLKLEDEEGIDCLPNSTIFEQLALMGYEKISQKLTFYKPFFSPQWKFLIHTILQCLSPKTTAWNEFSSTMASAIICLATNQKFNFSKFIFEGMIRNLDNVSGKFLMYPSPRQATLIRRIEFQYAVSTNFQSL